MLRWATYRFDPYDRHNLFCFTIVLCLRPVTYMHTSFLVLLLRFKFDLDTFPTRAFYYSCVLSVILIGAANIVLSVRLKGPVRWRGVTFGYLIFWLGLVNVHISRSEYFELLVSSLAHLVTACLTCLLQQQQQQNSSFIGWRLAYLN